MGKRLLEKNFENEKNKKKIKEEIKEYITLRDSLRKKKVVRSVS